jgi:hypothetical protein
MKDMIIKEGKEHGAAIALGGKGGELSLYC